MSGFCREFGLFLLVVVLVGVTRSRLKGWMTVVYYADLFPFVLKTRTDWTIITKYASSRPVSQSDKTRHRSFYQPVLMLNHAVNLLIWFCER